jgi:uncharacterized MAPEG superfamily protein
LLHSEPHLLALYALIVAITMVVQVGAAAMTVGLPYLSSARDAQKPLGTVPERLRRTVDNSVVALALVAPAVLLVETGGVGIPQTVLAMQVFVLARIAFAALYPLGIPYARTAVWAAGFLAILFLYLIALTAPLT